ncbi:glutamine amidotransferase [Rhodotorula toruloides]|uniref:glutaminase n=1 Tax=Rhodotorula toruloides TaxID=5286 RepID=A0A511KLS6_RHOTO|nr:glutamine amidotransferase [Rhodotorula toruloides]
MSPAPAPTAVGVLALQGSFAEHIHALESLDPPQRVVAVRTPADLEQCRALVIPGGESTTISLLIRKSGLYEPLNEFIKLAKEDKGRSVWGTCAGMILLAREIDGPTSEGWQAFDAMDVKVARNQYGRQLQSFSYSVSLPFISRPSDPVLATFIRAPVLHSLLPPSPSSSSTPPVEPLARIPPSLIPPPARAKSATGGSTSLGPDADVVMYRQGGLLASSWHPELNKQDVRVHEWWLTEMVLKGT